MKTTRLTIEVDATSIDGVLDKVRQLKNELAELGMPINLGGLVDATFTPEEAHPQGGTGLRCMDILIMEKTKELSELMHRRYVEHLQP